MCARLFGPLPGYKLVDEGGWGRVERLKASRRSLVPIVDATPYDAVDAMLEALQPKSGDVLYDLGCGDGRILLAAVRDYGCQAVGIEVDPMVSERARKNLESAGIPRRWRVVLGDARNYNLDRATIVTCYLYPDLMAELLPKVRYARAVVSYSHDLPDRPARRLDVAGGHHLYLWTEADATTPAVVWPPLQPRFPALFGIDTSAARNHK